MTASHWQTWRDGEGVRLELNDEIYGPFRNEHEAKRRLDELLARSARLRDLAATYAGDWTEDQDGAPFQELAESRYAAIINRAHYDEAPDWWISAYDAMSDALAWLGDSVLEGHDPVGVIDLDTGETHGVHVATPLVSDIGGEGAPAVPWDVSDLPAIEPGEGATSRNGWGG